MMRLLIERRLIDHVGTFAHDVFCELRLEAINKPGYISGETLRDVDDPNHYIVISSWQSQQDCDAWPDLDESRRADEQFRAVLAEPEKATVWS